MRNSFNFLYKILDNPYIYLFSQLVLAPGSKIFTKRILNPLVTNMKPEQKILDIGCGPNSILNKYGISPDGVDISESYINLFNLNKCGKGYVSSSECLPFKSDVYDYIFNFGLLHHLSDDSLCKTVGEMIRTAKNGGVIIVIDAVFPKNKWKKPFAYLIRKYDRGLYVRHQYQQQNLLSKFGNWEITRHPYSFNGLELLLCILIVKK